MSSDARRITVQELRSLVDWSLGAVTRRVGESIPLDADFYPALPVTSMFQRGGPSDTPSTDDFGFGSLVDELDLLRRSVLRGGDDLPDIVLERLGYLFLYLSWLMGPQQSPKGSE